MKIKLCISKQVKIEPELLEKKINIYLEKKFYKVIDRGPDFVAFMDDDDSDRDRTRSDYHNRIGEGKFEFYSKGDLTLLRLTYFTPVLYPILLIILFLGIGIYAGSMIPIFFSFVYTIPVFFRIFNLYDTVFDEVIQTDSE